MSRTIRELRKAKEESDRGNYPAKHKILVGLMRKRPDDFRIDSESGRFVGITHKSGFRFHLPKDVLPGTIQKDPEEDHLEAWQQVPKQAVEIAVKIARSNPSGPERPVQWYQVENGDKWLDFGAPPAGVGEPPWVRVINPREAKVSSLLGPLAQLWHIKPHPIQRLYGGPTPLASVIAGGLLGASLGYGAGWLGEWLLPDGWVNKKRLRLVGGILGGLAGAAPGAYLGLLGMQMRRNNPWMAWVEPNVLFGKQADHVRDLPDTPDWVKSAIDSTGALFMPSIPVDAFNRAVWQDPATPVPMRAATSGLVQGASALRGGSNLVSPADIASLAVGAGSGLLSATLVGKTLGALAGLTPQAQQKLQSMGMWAGLIKGVVPMALGAG